MEIVDSGVLPSSFMEFAVPSTFAKETLYYVTQYGQFICDENYYIERNSLDMYLFVYVKSGRLYVKTRGREEAAGPGMVVLLDCRNHHAYYCREKTEFYWFHFKGDNIDRYAEFLYGKYGFCVMHAQAPERIWKYVDRIFSYLQSYSGSEHMISLQIAKCLARLAVDDGQMAGNNMFTPVISYIREHYAEEITLDQLASVCGLSKSYFIREFKKQIGSTPHDYLLFYRLRQAKQELRSTADSVEEIADRCGFNSASHFTRAFRKENAMTPSQFRHMKF